MRHETSVIPDSHLAAIGHVANMTANLEFEIDRGIWDLVGAPQQLTACVTAQLISVHPRMRAFIALAELLGAAADTVQKLKSLSGELGGLIEKRNRYVHDPRMIRPSDGVVARLQITAKPAVHFGFIDETANEVRAVGESIKSKGEEFIDLRDRAVAEVKASLSKSPLRLDQILPGPDL